MGAAAQGDRARRRAGATALTAAVIGGLLGGVPTAQAAPVPGPGGHPAGAADNVEVVGFVSETDLASALMRPDPARATAREIMSQPSIVIDEFAPADEVIDALRSRRIHHLPVARGGRLVGIITPLDVLRWFVEHERPLPDDAG